MSMFENNLKEWFFSLSKDEQNFAINNVLDNIIFNSDQDIIIFLNEMKQFFESKEIFFDDNFKFIQQTN